MLNKNVFVLLAFICLVSIIPLFVFGHEFSHIYFNDFRWSGYCFLNCPNTSESVYTGFGGETDSPSSPPIIGVFLNKPTTTYTLTNYTTSKKLNFTCTSGTTGTCTNTYVTINGTTYTNTYEFTLNGVGEYTITYYSTDDQNNTETPRTITESITSSTITRKTVGSGCGIISSFSLFGLLIIVVLGFLAMSIFITKDITMSVVVTTIVALIIGAVILVFGANIVGIACNAAMTIA